MDVIFHEAFTNIQLIRVQVQSMALLITTTHKKTHSKISIRECEKWWKDRNFWDYSMNWSTLKYLELDSFPYRRKQKHVNTTAIYITIEMWTGMHSWKSCVQPLSERFVSAFSLLHGNGSQNKHSVSAFGCSEKLCALSYKILNNLCIGKSLSRIEWLRWCCPSFFSRFCLFVDMAKVCNMLVSNAVRLHEYAIDAVKTTILYAAHTSARWEIERNKSLCRLNRCFFTLHFVSFFFMYICDSVEHLVFTRRYQRMKKNEDGLVIFPLYFKTLGMKHSIFWFYF